jgi:hypothetical protein
LKYLIAIACIAVIAGPALADSFDEKDIAACEAQIQQGMKTSPATYQRIKIEDLGKNIRGDRLLAITYDAQNIYGALIRDRHVCPLFRPTEAEIDAMIAKKKAQDAEMQKTRDSMKDAW